MIHDDSSSERSAVVQQNSRAWDALARQNASLTKPASDEELRNPLAVVDPLGWLGGNIAGQRVLCLASGGGRQSALYAAAGAEVTVVDVSDDMLARDRAVAAERGYSIRAIKGSMDDLSMLGAAEFDVVVQPVSTCYVSEIQVVYREIARVLRDGGRYVSQHKSPTSLQAELKPTGRGYELTEPYYRTGPLPAAAVSRLREAGTVEFLHRWEELLGGLCRAGFVIEDLVEPLHADELAERGAFGHRARFVAPYVRVKAQRVSQSLIKAQAAILRR